MPSSAVGDRELPRRAYQTVTPGTARQPGPQEGAVPPAWPRLGGAPRQRHAPRLAARRGLRSDALDRSAGRDQQGGGTAFRRCRPAAVAARRPRIGQPASRSSADAAPSIARPAAAAERARRRSSIPSAGAGPSQELLDLLGPVRPGRVRSPEPRLRPARADLRQARPRSPRARRPLSAGRARRDRRPATRPSAVDQVVRNSSPGRAWFGPRRRQPRVLEPLPGHLVEVRLQYVVRHLSAPLRSRSASACRARSSAGRR